MPEQNSIKYKIALSFIKGMTQVSAVDILSCEAGLESFFELETQALVNLFGKMLPQFRQEIRSSALERAEKELEWLDSHPSVQVLFIGDEDYPERLAQCEDAPIVLYVAGNSGILNSNRIVSMVGTRHSTVYGESFISRFVTDLKEVDQNIMITSGLAYGIDIASHKAALKNGMPTAAVVAHGLSTIYPSAHRAYAAEIISQGGAIITEYPHDASIHRSNFLARNRIIAGVADCTVVVESDIKGGALATATNGFDYGRDIFAVPGRVNDRYSSGCNRLISQQKAAILTSAADLIDAMKWGTAKKTEEGRQRSLDLFLPPERQRVVDYVIKTEALEKNLLLNKMAVDLGMTLSSLNDLLSEMEFDNQIVRTPGGKLKVIL